MVLYKNNVTQVYYTYGNWEKNLNNVKKKALEIDEIPPVILKELPRKAVVLLTCIFI